jgi:hypothetical protein
VNGRPAPVPDRNGWRSAARYKALLLADRRSFAWEWLRRTDSYRKNWLDRSLPPAAFGLLAYEDPDLATPDARPIWAPDADPRVLDSEGRDEAAGPADMLDVRALSDFVSVEVGAAGTEHWLLSDGYWAVRLDLHDGTLLGGPLLLEHRLRGLRGAEPRMHALERLVALASEGEMPARLRPRERRAPRWILELRTADALAAGASQQDMARAFFGTAIAEARWRLESGSYRLRVQRLIRAARRHLADPFSGPWFT